MTDRKPMLDRPVLVEGKYDKIKLQSLFQGCILTTDGFGLFRRGDKQALFRQLAKEKGIIVLADSDGGGTQIRSFLRGILPPDKVVHLYIPRIEGKEKRKKAPSRSGMLGVEGMEAALLKRLLLPYTSDSAPKVQVTPVTKSVLYADGLSGGEGSAERRAALCLALALPSDLPANALIEVLNLLGGLEFYRAERAKLAEKIKN